MYLRVGQAAKITRLLAANVLEGSSLKTLAFMIGSQEYGLEQKKVKEIHSYQDIQKLTVMHAPYIGTVNLADKPIPIVDLRIRFKVQNIDDSNPATVLVLNLKHNRTVAVVVDNLTDSLSLENVNFSQVPKMISVIHRKYLFGLTAAKGGMLIFVDIEKLLSSAELSI
jgi:purine-binding chemotaxis protein CheW